MRKALVYLGLAAAMALVSLAHAATPPVSNKYQHIYYTWVAPNSTFPDCSATVTSSCLSNYTLSQTPPSGVAAVTLTIANGSVAAGGTVSYVYGPGGFLYCGTWNVSVVANYLDEAGATVPSAAFPATVAVPCPLAASPVTGLLGTPAP